MPIPNEELQARYEGIRRDLIPAVKEFLEVMDPKETARQALALKQFIKEEKGLEGLSDVGTFNPYFALSSGIDIGVVLGGQLAEENTICPECKIAVVDLIAAARKFVQKVDDGRARSVESYGEFKAALAQLDTTHDDDTVGGA